MVERGVLAVVLGLGLATPVMAATAAVAHLAPGSGRIAWPVGGLAAAAAFFTGWRCKTRFPASIDGAARRHPVRTVLWLLLSVIALLQVGRLGAFMVDPANTYGSAFPDPGLTNHMCMTAYVQAAALARDGDPNLYDEQHWPAFHPKSTKEAPSTVWELGPRLEDPYEYPPQFLLLPRLALALTNHFLIIRAAWFAVQCLAFLAVALLLAGGLEGRDRVVVGLLVPALVASIPFLVNLQFGQAHLFTFTLSLGAMVAFRRARSPLGGLLLGAATVFKLFPGLLVLYLALRRRWRDLAWTVAAGVAITLVALIVLGKAPFVEFVRYQLPRIGNGDAFSFFRREWFYVSRNMGISGLIFKLGLLGLPGMTARAAGVVGWIYTLVLIALVVRAARRRELSAFGEALLWMGLLCLGSLRSPLAPGIYVSVGALWLMLLLAARAHRSRDVVFIILGFAIIPGPPPLPTPVLDVAVAFLGQLAFVALAVHAVGSHQAQKEVVDRGAA
jgi:hypothetical protein